MKEDIEYAFEHLLTELENNELDYDEKRSLYLKLRCTLQQQLLV
jgi:hypothetical protein